MRPWLLFPPYARRRTSRLLAQGKRVLEAKRVDAAGVIFDEALDAARIGFGSEQPGVVEAMIWAGYALSLRERHEEALNIADEMTRLVGRWALEPDSEHSVYFNAGAFFLRAGDPRTAAEHFERAAHPRLEKDDAPPRLDALASAALCHRYLFELEKSDEIARSFTAVEPLACATQCLMLGATAVFRRTQREAQRAVGIYERALHALGDEVGYREPPGARQLPLLLAMLWSRLSAALYASGDGDEATRSAERATVHAERARCHDDCMMIVHHDRGDVASDPVDAARHFDEAIAVRTRSCGAKHPRTVESTLRRAQVASALGDRSTASRLAESIVSTHSRLLGVEHPFVRDALALV